MNPWEKAIWYLTMALTAAVLGRLWRSGLIKIYRLFFAYLACDLILSLGALTFDFRSKAYGNFYFSAQTLKIIIAAFLLVEIYSLALESHPALARFGRSVVGYILAAAALFPLIGVWVNHSGSAGAPPYIRAFFLFEQTMDATMALFLILISIFMGWFPVRMRRNVIVYIGGFIIWSLSRSALVYIVNERFNDKKINAVCNIVRMCIEVGCLAFWLIELRRGGENRTAVVGHLWNRAEAERLTGQLDAINNSLERLRRG